MVQESDWSSWEDPISAQGRSYWAPAGWRSWTEQLGQGVLGVISSHLGSHPVRPIGEVGCHQPGDKRKPSAF